MSRSKPTSGGWKASLAAVLKAHNAAKVNGSVASHATRDKRADVLYGVPPASRHFYTVRSPFLG